MDLKEFIKDIPDFPNEGVVFRDISPLLYDAQAFRSAILQLASLVGEVDVIAAPEARGFVFASALAFHLQKPFVLIRKPGKLPSKVIAESYDLEYGQNTLEITTDLILPDHKVCIVDDILATGGTLVASANLIRKVGARVANIITLVDLTYIPKEKDLAQYKTFSVINY